VQGHTEALAQEILDILFRHDPLGTAYDPKFDRTEYLPETRSILALLDQAHGESELESVVRRAFETNGALGEASDARLAAAAREIWSAWRRTVDRRLPPGPPPST